MPGCRDSVISVFACANACGADAIMPSSATTPVVRPRIFRFINILPAALILLTGPRRCTNTLVHLRSRRSLGNSTGRQETCRQDLPFQDLPPNEPLAGHSAPFADQIRRTARP